MSFVLKAEDSPEETWPKRKRLLWIVVDTTDRAQLATHLRPISHSTMIARKSKSSARINQTVQALGYSIEEVVFDSIPATDSWFHCASFVLQRQGKSTIPSETG